MKKDPEPDEPHVKRGGDTRSPIPQTYETHAHAHMSLKGNTPSDYHQLQEAMRALLREAIEFVKRHPRHPLNTVLHSDHDIGKGVRLSLIDIDHDGACDEIFLETQRKGGD